MTYIEINITAPEESRDALINRMSEMGAIGFIEQDGWLIAYAEYHAFFLSHSCSLRSCTRTLF